MAIGTQGKLNELNNWHKTDGSIQNEYGNVNYEYKKLKRIYKTSKEEYKLAQEELEIARDDLYNAPFTKMLSARRKVKTAKKILKLKKQKYLLDRENYKQKLKELRQLKREIRVEYNLHREYVIFFKRVQEAQRMGITLPKYIMDEYTNHKSIYLSEKYAVDKNGKRNYLTYANPSCSKDVSTLIWEKKQQNMKDTLQNAITQVKEKFTSKEDDGR